ncbi:hypothetical protein K440DRAFT_635942 [Wilcoxina mikolae CBS 423.85]|nr:hypothetical protein K440DRAFT_635942 [Wilcoxina mikolae CBS 423.85]
MSQRITTSEAPMNTDGEIFPGAAIAAVSIGNEIRVFFQDVHGYIREAKGNGATWSGGTFKDILFPAKPGSPLAAAVSNSGKVSSSTLHPRYSYHSENTDDTV